jgi:hypothetical protein
LFSFFFSYKHFTENDWKLVIFSDEKKFTCDSPSGKTYVQRPVSHRYDSQYMIQKHTHNKNDSPACINAIAFFSGVGKGFIYCYEEELTSKFLIKILKQHFFPAANKLYPNHEDYKILWDNDSTHTSGEMEKWLNDRLLFQKIIRIPSRSPELNITENLWSLLAPKVEQHNATTVEELKKAIEVEWDKIDVTVLKKMSDSMVSRCNEIIASEGHKINH